MGSILLAVAVLLWRRKRVGRILGAVLWSVSVCSAYFSSGSRNWGDIAFNVLMLGLILAGWGAAGEALG